MSVLGVSSIAAKPSQQHKIFHWVINDDIITAARERFCSTQVFGLGQETDVLLITRARASKVPLFKLGETLEHSDGC